MGEVVAGSFKKSLVDEKGRINNLNDMYMDNENYSKNSIMINPFIHGIFDNFTYFEKEIQNVPDINYIHNVANLIINNLPLPELKLYHRYTLGENSNLHSCCVTKEDKKLLIALACLYRPNAISKSAHIEFRLPFDTISCSFQNAVKNNTKSIEMKLRGGSDNERYDAPIFKGMISDIANAQIEVVLFKEKEYADKYLSYQLV